MKVITIDKNTFMKNCIEVNTRDNTYDQEFLNKITPNYRHFIYNLKINNIDIGLYDPEETTEELKDILEKNDDNIYIHFGENNTCNIIYKKTKFDLEPNEKKFGKDVMQFFNELLNKYIDTDVALFKERINYKQIYDYCIKSFEGGISNDLSKIKPYPKSYSSSETYDILVDLYLYNIYINEIYMTKYGTNVIFKKLIATNELNSNILFNKPNNAIDIWAESQDKDGNTNKQKFVIIQTHTTKQFIIDSRIFNKLYEKYFLSKETETAVKLNFLKNLIDDIMKYTVIIKEWIKFQKLLSTYYNDAPYRTKIDNELKYIVNTSIITYLKLNDDGTKLQNDYRFGDIDTTNNILKLTYNPDNVKYYNNENKLKYIVEPNKNVIKEISETKETTLETNKSRSTTIKTRPRSRPTTAKKTAEPPQQQQPIPEKEEFLKPKKYVFGEFTKIFKADETNEEISNKMDSVVDAILNKKSVFMVTNGVSGSGKTSTLIGLNSEDDGIIPNLCCNICNTGSITNITVHVYETFAEKETMKGHEDIQDRQFIFNYDKKTNILLLLNNKSYDNLPVIHKYRVNKDVLKDKPLIVYDDQQKQISFKENLNFSDFLFYYLKVDRYIKKTTTNTESSISNYLISIKFNTEYLIVCDLASVETKYPNFLDPKNIDNVDHYKFLLENSNNIYDDDVIQINSDDAADNLYRNMYTHYLDSTENINKIINAVKSKTSLNDIIIINNKYILFLINIVNDKDIICNFLFQEHENTNNTTNEEEIEQNMVEIEKLNKEIQTFQENRFIKFDIKQMDIITKYIAKIKEITNNNSNDEQENKKKNVEFQKFYTIYIKNVVEYYNLFIDKFSTKLLKMDDWNIPTLETYIDPKKVSIFTAKISGFNNTATMEIEIIGNNTKRIPKYLPKFIYDVFSFKKNIEEICKRENIINVNTYDERKKKFYNLNLNTFISNINSIKNIEHIYNLDKKFEKNLTLYYKNIDIDIGFLCKNINIFINLDNKNFNEYLNTNYTKYALITDACDKRNKEIDYTNDYINIILNNISKLNVFNYLDQCFEQYNIIENKNELNMNEIFKNLKDKITIQQKNLILCMFTVINISPYHNNPPKNPYMNLSEIEKNKKDNTEEEVKNISISNRSNIIGSLEILDKFSKNNTIKYLCFE
jgi:hypothetical protein